MTTLEEHVARAIGTQCLFMDKQHGILAARAAIAAVHEREGADTPAEQEFPLGQAGPTQKLDAGSEGAPVPSSVTTRGSNPPDPAEAMRARCEAIARDSRKRYLELAEPIRSSFEKAANALGQVADAIAALRGKPVSEWKPIDTAPKDGTQILAWSKEWQCPAVMSHETYDETGYWEFRESLISDEAGEGFPTHWMSLPEPPR